VNAPRSVTHGHYIQEILQHAGLCHRQFGLSDIADELPGICMLLTVGEAQFSSSVRQALRNWIDNGGIWISIAGTCGCQEWFGVEVERASFAGWGGAGACVLGEGYLQPHDGGHHALSHLSKPLHYFNGVAVRATTASVLASVLDSHQRTTGRAALTEQSAGRGRCLLLAADAIGSVVRIQQGTAVTRDGVPAPDGTASISDGVLKSDDGQVLDWHFDREPLPEFEPFRIFRQPVADQWRELVLRCIFHEAIRAKVPLPLLWLYPRDLPALATMSHDTDLSDDGLMRKMMQVMAERSVRSTWCVMLPGYGAEIVAELKAAGHELAMHYDALSDGCTWSQAELGRQHSALSRQFGIPPRTNKNHLLRWEGDTEFFDWLVACDVQLDQSKGPSKSGGAGFAFGSCHPYFPVAPDGRRIDVLELPLLAQDLPRFAPEPLAEHLLDAVLAQHGVAHFLFHPNHILTPGRPETIGRVIDAARKRGMQWWTARQLNDWERARRSIRWENYTFSTTRCQVTLRTAVPLADASLLWLAPEAIGAESSGKPLEHRTVTRWGTVFSAITIPSDPSGGGDFGIRLSPQA
jgi:hypothetical protein